MRMHSSKYVLRNCFRQCVICKKIEIVHRQAISIHEQIEFDLNSYSVGLLCYAFYRIAKGI